MTITFLVSRKAHARALGDVTRRTRSYKICVVFLVVLPMLILAYAFLTRANIGEFVLNNLMFLVLGPLLVFVGFPLTYYLNVSRMHKNNAILNKPQTFEITPEHLAMRGPLHNSDVSWEAVYRVVETRHRFLFFVSRYAAHFIPKESLSVDEIQSLRELLARLLPGRVDLRGDESVAPAAA